MSATTPKDLDDLEFSNTNAWDTRQLVTMALMCAIAALLSFVQLPLIPGVTFLTYDPSLMPAMVCGFAFGPGAGIAVGAIAAVIHGLILGEWVGSLMNIVATLCFVWPAAAIYRRKRTFKSGIIGLLVGVLAATAGAVVSKPHHRRGVLVRQRRCHPPYAIARHPAVQPGKRHRERHIDADRVQGGLEPDYPEEIPSQGPLTRVGSHEKQ